MPKKKIHYMTMLNLVTVGNVLAAFLVIGIVLGTTYYRYMRTDVMNLMRNNVEQAYSYISAYVTGGCDAANTLTTDVELDRAVENYTSDDVARTVEGKKMMDYILQNAMANNPSIENIAIGTAGGMIVKDRYGFDIGRYGSQLREAGWYQELLEGEGFEIVAEAGDGQEALALYEKYHPVIVITDIRLPKMDGIRMMKALAGRKVSFIVISAYDDFQYAKESISIGVVNYFLKGNMDREELVETLRSLKSRYAREERERRRERAYTIRELYLSPKSVLEVLPGVPEKGRARLLYYMAENANTQMLDAMVCDFFLRDKMGCVRLESESGSWFLYVSGDEDETVCELSRMFERYVDEEIILVGSRRLDRYPDIKEAVYHVLLMREFRIRKGKGRMPGEQADEERALVRIRQTETELLEALKFRKYDEANELLGELQSAMIESMSPMVLFDGIYRLLGYFARYNEEIHAARTYSVLMESLDLETIFDALALYVDELRGKREDNGNDYILRVNAHVR